MNRRVSLLLVLGLLLAVSAATGAVPRGDIDPALRGLLDRPAAEAAGVLAAAAADRPSVLLPRSLYPAVEAGAPPRLEVFLTADPGARLDGAGVESYPLGGDLYAARVTLEGLRRVVAEDGVLAARLSRPVRPALDRSAAFLGLARVRRADPGTGEFSGLTGRGVVVGVVDSGLDWDHPDFRNPDGSTRVVWFWDQTIPFARPPAGYPFGDEFDARDIEGAFAPARDPSGHGTHVTGIAAGNGRGSFVEGEGVRYAGVAPEAVLVGVRTNFTEFGVALGARYVFERAADLGLPVVLNLSLGNQYGPHVGDTPFERSLEANLGPGRLLVAAAGNDGNRDLHAEADVPGGETLTLPFEFGEYDKSSPDPRFLTLEGWFDAGNRYRVTLVDPQGNRVGPVGWGTEDARLETNRGVIHAWNTEDSGYGTLSIDIEDNLNSVRRATGVWTLEIEGVDVPADPGIDFWITNWAFDSTDYPGFLERVDRRETILVPATGSRIIAVGAISTRSCWPGMDGAEHCYTSDPEEGSVAYFSALGPTADGRTKPEILAPGYGVISARSGTLDPDRYQPGVLPSVTVPGGLYWINQGTSMAAPQVTGTVALLLQQYPRLTYDQAVARLTARSSPMVDPRIGETVRVLRTANAVLPPVAVVLSEAELTPGGLLLRWFTGKALGAPRYRVYRDFPGMDADAPPVGNGVRGDNPYEVLDRHPEAGREQRYRIVAVDEAGLESDLDTVRVEVAGTARAVLRPAVPNPAAGPARATFFLPVSASAGTWRVEVIDVQGRKVTEAASGRFDPPGGEFSLRWDLRDAGGRRVPGGIYFLRLSWSGDSGTRLGTRVTRLVVLP